MNRDFAWRRCPKLCTRKKDDSARYSAEKGWKINTKNDAYLDQFLCFEGKIEELFKLRIFLLLIDYRRLVAFNPGRLHPFLSVPLEPQAREHSGDFLHFFGSRFLPGCLRCPD